jgi:HlyD family secretion protein
MVRKFVLNSPLKSPLSRSLIALASITLLGTGGILVFKKFNPPQVSQPIVSTTPQNTDNDVVTALGRVEPEGEVIKLSAPASMEKLRVDQLLVKEGQRIRYRQVIAILDNHKRLQVALKQAQQQVKIARANLAQVKSGAKAGAIATQKASISRVKAQFVGDSTALKATIARLEVELQNAKTEYQRYNSLYQEGAIAASTLDSKRLTLDSAQQQLNESKANFSRILRTGPEQINEAEATLNQIAEVRPTDIQEAKARLDSSIIDVEKAKTDLEYTYVRSPLNGQVIKINAKEGEAIGDQGIADLGRTGQMYVVAEIYETDIAKIKLNQIATITSDSLEGKLIGQIDHIGLQINKKDALNTDPTADIDARVVEVKIRLNPQDSQRVKALTRLNVKVSIDLSK